MFIIDHQTSNSGFQLYTAASTFFSDHQQISPIIPKYKTVAMSRHVKEVRASEAFIFLTAIPYLNIETLPSSLDEKCAICTEPYLETSGELRDPLDAPVRIRCGHIFGHNCLVRWMLSDNFDNQCPYCRSQVVDESDLESPDPNVAVQWGCFERFLLRNFHDTSNRRQEWLDRIDQYPYEIMNVGCTASEVSNKDRAMMIWEEVLDRVDREDEEWRLFQLQLHEDQLERDRHAVAEAALRLELQQENNRRWSQHRAAIMVSVAGIVIFAQLGLMWNSYQNGAQWPTGVPQIDVDTCGWLLATLIAIGSPWQLYVLVGLFSPGLVTSFCGQLALITFGGLGLVNDVLFHVVPDTAAEI